MDYLRFSQFFSYFISSLTLMKKLIPLNQTNNIYVVYIASDNTNILLIILDGVISPKPIFPPTIAEK